MTYFGTSAPFLLACRKAGLVPRELADLSALRGARLDRRAAAARGLPLGVRGGQRRPLQLQSLSGGTDVCTGFVGGVAAAAGVRRARSPAGAWARKVEAFDPTGKPVIGEVGELVITAPMPSHAGRLLERPGRRALPRGVLRRLPRRVAARRLDHHHRARVAASSPAAPTPPSTGAACAWARASSTRWSRGCDEVVDSVVVHLEDAEGGAGELLLFVVLADGLDARRRAARPDRPRAAHGAVAPARPGRDLPGARGAAHAVRQEAGGAGQADPHRHAGRTPAAAKGALANPESLAAFERCAQRRGPTVVDACAGADRRSARDQARCALGG